MFAHQIDGLATPDTLPTQEKPQSPETDVKWPYKVRHRKNGPVVAKIYRPCQGRDSYRVAWLAAGKRVMKSFPRFAGQDGAREFAENLAKDIAQGSQVAALTPAEARSAFAVRDALEAFRLETGRTISPIQAVTEYLGVIRKLGNRPLPEAVDGFLGTVATVKRVDLSAAVEDFVAAREGKTKSKEGKRAQLSSTYAYNTGLWLRNFAAEFPGQTLCDFTKELLDFYFANKKRTDLAPKSRNHIRNTLAIFFGWAVKHDYLPAKHRLLETPSMERETITGEETDFYRPAEFKALLEAADATLRPIIALQGLAGIRLQEAQRLTWSDVFGTAGHIAITATKSKTRSRRLVKMVPALAAWLRPYRGMAGPLWTQSRDTYHAQLAAIRESKKVPGRKNGLRHAFCSFHFALHGNENLTAQQAGNSPSVIHQAYKGLATKKEAKAWFNVRPAKTAASGKIITLPQKGVAA